MLPALQRINSNQNSDGGWGLWPGSPSQPTTSAYVIIGLVEARKSGYTLSDSVLANGLNYLSANLPDISTGQETWQNNQAAFMLFALAQGGQPADAMATDLYASRGNLDIYGQAFLMQAMYISNPKDERIQNLLSAINSAAAKSAASAWWNEKSVDYWNWNTDERTTAIVLNALIQVDPKNALIPNGIRWMMKQSSAGHWYSTPGDRLELDGTDELVELFRGIPDGLPVCDRAEWAGAPIRPGECGQFDGNEYFTHYGR